MPWKLQHLAVCNHTSAGHRESLLCPGGCSWQLPGVLMEMCPWLVPNQPLPLVSTESLFSQRLKEIIFIAWSIFLSVLSHTSWPTRKFVGTSGGWVPSFTSCPPHSHFSAYSSFTFLALCSLGCFCSTAARSKPGWSLPGDLSCQGEALFLLLPHLCTTTATMQGSSFAVIRAVSVKSNFCQPLSSESCLAGLGGTQDFLLCHCPLSLFK